MKKLLLTLACASSLFATSSAYAQAPGISWKNIYYYYAASEKGAYAEPTTDGGYVAAAVAVNYLWVFRLDGSGTKLWDRCLTTGTGLVTVYAVKQTADGGYVAAGTDYDGGTGDSTGNHGIRDMLVVKLNSSGAVEWKKAYGGSLNEEAYSIEQTPDGGYIVSGITSSNDGQVTGWHGYTDCWVIKLDASGNLTWQKALGGGNYDYATSIIPTSDGGYILAGYSGSKDGDVTGTHWGGSDNDVWVAKLTSTGSISWQKSYGGSDEDQAYSIRQTSDGGYIVAGSTISTDGLVTGKHSGGNQNYWVLKLDVSGNLTWQKCLGGSGTGIGAGSGNDIAYCIRQTTDGGYVVGGTVISGAATNGDITGYHGTTGSDYWIVKLDGTGSISWQECLGGTGTEDCRSVVPTADGGYIVAGMSVYSNNGDVSSPDYGNAHPWIVKLGGASAVQQVWNGSIKVAVYPNPASDKVTFDDLPIGSTLRITDIMGKTVYTSKTTRISETVATGSFASGVYVAQIENGGGVCQVKFVVSK